ncbi:hypothetical protein QVD17_25059 [Tagetes erecta]|uniref:DUF4408 domain-containing protein n=1 Tax=Tagetes erecta TaxID=13708 RepID=A0AAD8KFP9_TARER|nr:hypothetical protein QVD17_25059 [Tagetes erecta]
MLQYHQFQKLAKLFRLIELLSSMLLFSWISSRLPLVIRMLIDYFHHLVSIIINPLFIFLIGNVIIVTLVLKSSQVNETRSNVDDCGSDLYNTIANNVANNVTNNIVVNNVTQHEEIVYHDKGIVCEVMKHDEIEGDEAMNYMCLRNSVSDSDRKVYNRSKSENLMKKTCLGHDKVVGKLKRSETEIRRREVEFSDVVVDELSNEEFQKRIEGFIAKQIRFHHLEKLAIVAHS